MSDFTDFTKFIRDLFASWWGWVFVILGAISTTATFAASFHPGFIVPKGVLFAVAILCWLIAPFDLYRKLREEIAGLQSEIAAQPKAQLVIYDQRGSRYYVEVTTPTGAPQQRRGVYLELHVMVENKGNRNAILRDFGLTVRETNWSQRPVEPQARNNIQTPTHIQQVRQDFILRAGSVTVPAHDFLTGIIPFYLPVEAIPQADAQVLHCSLTIADTEGNTSHQEVTLQRG